MEDVIEYLKDLQRRKAYGTVLVTVEQGKIVMFERRETVKLPK